jgi:transcriptional regulator
MRVSIKHFTPKVIEMTNKGHKLGEIAEALGLTKKQVSNLKTHHVSPTLLKKAVDVPLKRGEKAWATRRANAKNEVVNARPRLIDLNGLVIEIHSSMIKKVIISEKNTIKVF